jgi:hypothetical protein
MPRLEETFEAWSRVSDHGERDMVEAHGMSLEAVSSERA